MWMIIIIISYDSNAQVHVQMLFSVYQFGCLYSEEWNGGMEQWNGMEWPRP